MAQDLLKTSIGKFRLEVPIMSFAALKQLEEDIKDFKLAYRTKLTYEQILDIERKESIINKEYARRIDFNKGDLLQQKAARNKRLNWKKRYF